MNRLTLPTALATIGLLFLVAGCVIQVRPDGGLRIDLPPMIPVTLIANPPNTATATVTATTTLTSTPTMTATTTVTATPTTTVTATATVTATSTATATGTVTATATVTTTAMPTATATMTTTSTPLVTPTGTVTATGTTLPPGTPPLTPTGTITATGTPLVTPTGTITATGTTMPPGTPPLTPTGTITATGTPISPTGTPLTRTPPVTPQPGTLTPAPPGSATPTPTAAATRTITPTPTRMTGTPTGTLTVTPTRGATMTVTTTPTSATPPATATPIPGTVFVGSHRGYEADGMYTVVGEVINNAGFPVFNVKVIASFYDANGTLVGAQESVTILPRIGIELSSPFKLSIPSSGNVSRYELTLVWDDISIIDYQELTLLSQETRSQQPLEIVGELRNDGSVGVSNIVVVVTLYDASGAVVDVYLGTVSKPDLASDEITPYSIVAPNTELEYDHFTVQAQGSLVLF